MPKGVKDRVRDTPVCLIIPPSTFLADERVFPFLGILKVAAELRANGNHVEVLDLSGYGNYEEIVAAYVESTEIRHFGITATTPQLPAAVRVAGVIRKAHHLPGQLGVLLGGPHATMTHTAASMDLVLGVRRRGTIAYEQLERMFDRIVVGDGEIAIFHALDPENHEVTIDAGNMKSSLFMAKGTLECYQWPARDLIDLDSYHYEIDGKRAFSAIAQLGCPYKCQFCGGRDSHAFRIARPREPADVAAELEATIRAGRVRGVSYEAVQMYDDEINVVPGNVEALCREFMALQDRLGIEMRFRAFVKAERFTPEDAKALYHAGWRVILSGVESGSDFILDVMQKNTTAEINERCLKISQDAGMEFKSLMSIGHAGETPATVDASVDWVLRTRPDDVDWTVITQYPGSPYYDHSELVDGAWLYTDPRHGARLWSSDGDFTKEVWSYKTRPGEYHSYVWTDELTADDLVTARDNAERVTRHELGLGPIATVAAQQFDRSMGGGLGNQILRSVN